MKLVSLNRYALFLSVLCALATPAFAAGGDDLIITPVEKPAAAEGSEAKKADPGSVVVGDMVVSHMHATTSKGHVDVFLTIKNNGKSDERITGAGSTWDIGDVVQVKKDKDKDVEGPISIDVPAGKSVELLESTQWLRITAVHTKPKDLSVLPFNLYFRHSPNTPLQIPFGKSESKSSGWFSE